MSLKSRLRLAISLLMTAVVIALSVLYADGFVDNEFDRIRHAARSLAGQIQAGVRAQLDAVPQATGSPEQTKATWTKALRENPLITATLRRALENWPMVTEIYLTGADGRVLASTEPANVNTHPAPRASIESLANQNPFLNARRALFGREDFEQIESLAILGETTPFVSTHIVISTAILSDNLVNPLKRLGWIFAVSLMVALLLAYLLPNLVLDPLVTLSARLDLMATGRFAGTEAPKRQAKEFAAVYSKLELLGQQFQGAQENADELRTNVEHLLERLEQAVLLVDPGGRLIMAGPNIRQLMNAAPEELSGKSLWDVVPADTELGGVIAEAMQAQETRGATEVRVATPDGERKLTVSCEPLFRMPANRLLGTLVTLRDAETRGTLEAELGLAGRLAALSRLTRGVAHEIKNPLNAITLHLEVLRNRMEEPAPELDIIGREISRLDRVVKTFLDFNRPVEPHMQEVDLGDLAEEISRLIEPQARDRDIEARLERDGATPISGDPDLLKQAVLNVVMNAIDAMPTGGMLVLRAYRMNDRCELTVADTGHGIPREVQERIFSLYFSTKQQGSGIGLAVAFRFVQLHDGRLEFTSEPGKGTTFRFVFPEAISTARRSALVTRSHGA